VVESKWRKTRLPFVVPRTPQNGFRNASYSRRLIFVRIVKDEANKSSPARPLYVALDLPRHRRNVEPVLGFLQHVS